MTDITLLDGGMGQELITRSGDAPTPLWATQVMLDHPGMVQQIHADFFGAGATIATTNTYCVHHDRLEGTPHAPMFSTLHNAAVLEALAARPAGAKVAGSIGPLGASYQPDKHPPHAEAVAKYTEVAQLIGPKVDLILCETVVSLAHARAILEGAATAGKPVWLAVSVSDSDGSKLRSGEAVSEVCDIAVNGGATALLINCSAPEAIPAALAAIRPSGLPFGAYANGFTQITEDFLADKPTVDALEPRRDLGPDAYAKHVMTWIDQGATIVGGCCEISPAHIAAIATAIRAAGHTII